MPVQRAGLKGDRLHLQHGPIDLVIGADGDRAAAFDAAERCLENVLSGLMDELDLLRRHNGPKPKGVTARKMWRAAQNHESFVTPMAAVAGAVAETVLDAMQKAGRLSRAFVNNGGDIALHLAPGTEFSIAMASPSGAGLGRITLRSSEVPRGIATSGQGGRSLSFGIAESVTVLARTAAQADVAATLIAGAVDLPDSPKIVRARAHDLRDDSDLEARLVVTSVDVLNCLEADAALERGVLAAQSLQARGLIHSASLHLQGQSRQVTTHINEVLENA